MHRISFFAVAFFIALPCTAHAAVSITISPAEVIQGDPALVTLSGVKAREVTSISWGGKALPLFLHDGKVAAIIGVDLGAKTGISTVKVTTADGAKVEKKLRIVPRKRISAPLGVPEKMGGNTKAGQNTLVYAISKENALLASVIATSSAFLNGDFQYPLQQVEVSDIFGYTRQTGAYNIAHRGTDFRAQTGTSLYALNDGVIRLAGSFIAYGKMVVIDHGSGISSYYLHLSKVNVREGEIVKKGSLIGLSGDSGYALMPHLHLSIKINGTSVDPMKFFALLGPKS